MELLRQVIPPVFGLLCLGMLALYVLAHARPRWLTGSVSIPYVFELKRNVGPRSYEFQTAIYAVFHRSLFDDFCHHFLTLDQVAWAVLAFAWGGWPALAVMVGLALAQAATFGEKVLLGLLAASWATFAALAVWITGLLGDEAPVLAMATIAGSAALRVLGHAGEPLPPLVGSDGLAFHPVRVNLSALVAMLVGWVAEFSSGIPYRLFPPQLALMAMRFGWKPARTLSKQSVDELSVRLGQGGWTAWEETRTLYSWHPEAAQRSETA